MTLSDISLIVRAGYEHYFSANPWTIVVTTEWPRATLQCLFFTLLGGVVAGEAGGEFAFVGAVTLSLLGSTVMGVGKIPSAEKWYGTYYRLLASRYRPLTTFTLRAVANLTQAMCALLVCLLIVGPLTGHLHLTVELTAILPLFALMAVTSTAAGLAVSSAALGRRADAMVLNGFIVLIQVCSGALIPLSLVPVLANIGMVLPLRNGILAVRALIDGRPWLEHFAAELLVGVGWAVACALLYAWQDYRARRHGTDDLY